MSDVGQILVGALIGYVIGMFPSADLVARIASRGSVDLRSSGSGNPGGLNAARVLGKKWGLLVIVMDAAKGALVIWVVSAVVWWAADWPMGWGPEPTVGLVVYAVLGAAMVQARFTLSARAGGADL